MSKFSIATRLADELGTTVSKARSFVDEVGEPAAREALQKAEDGTSWKIPAVAGIGTGGALLWRQQDVWREQAEATQDMSTKEAVEKLVNSDLPEDERQSLIEAIQAQAGDSSNNGSPGGDWFSNMSIQQMVIVLVVLLVVLQFILNKSSTVGLDNPGVQ